MLEKDGYSYRIDEKKLSGNLASLVKKYDLDVVELTPKELTTRVNNQQKKGYNYFEKDDRVLGLGLLSKGQGVMDEIQESGVWDSLWMLGLSTAAIRSTQTFSNETGGTSNGLKGSKNGRAYTLDRNKSAEAKFSGEDIFNYTNKVNEHMANPDRAVPAQTLKEVINGGISMSDPRGSSATMYYSKIYINDKKYNFEVLYDKPTNTVYHFKYDRRPLGPLPAVSKQ